MSQPLAPTVGFGSQELHGTNAGKLPGLPSDVFTDGSQIILRENLARPGSGDFGAAVQWYKSLSEYTP